MFKQIQNPTILTVLLSAGLFMIWGCSSISVKTDFDPESDFSTYKTYMWYAGEMPKDDALSANPLVKKRVASGVEKALETKGYSKGSEDDFDFVVIIHAGTKEKMQVTSYGYGGYGYGRHTDVHYYDETTLIIDLVDAEKKELVWRGTGVGTVKEYSDREEMQEAIDKVVAKILADFPPEKNSKV
jgi:hypothetical protein